MQRGPVGLVREEGQEVGSKSGHVRARLTFALGRKEAWVVPARATENRGMGPFGGRPGAPALEAALATCVPGLAATLQKTRVLRPPDSSETERARATATGRTKTGSCSQPQAPGPFRRLRNVGVTITTLRPQA